MIVSSTRNNNDVIEFVLYIPPSVLSADKVPYNEFADEVIGLVWSVKHKSWVVKDEAKFDAFCGVIFDRMTSEEFKGKLEVKDFNKSKSTISFYIDFVVLADDQRTEIANKRYKLRISDHKPDEGNVVDKSFIVQDQVSYRNAEAAMMKYVSGRINSLRKQYRDGKINISTKTTIEASTISFSPRRVHGMKIYFVDVKKHPEAVTELGYGKYSIIFNEDEGRNKSLKPCTTLGLGNTMTVKFGSNPQDYQRTTISRCTKGQADIKGCPLIQFR